SGHIHIRNGYQVVGVLQKIPTHQISNQTPRKGHSLICHYRSQYCSRRRDSEEQCLVKNQITDLWSCSSWHGLPVQLITRRRRPVRLYAENRYHIWSCYSASGRSGSSGSVKKLYRQSIRSGNTRIKYSNSGRLSTRFGYHYHIGRQQTNRWEVLSGASCGSSAHECLLGNQRTSAQGRRGHGDLECADLPQVARRHL